MPYKPTKTPSRFADLKTTLAQSQKSDEAIYQTVETLIDRLDGFSGGGTRRIFVGLGGGGNGDGGTDTGFGMDLDYLGNFVTGPTYNDGDIVIGPNNVLYMCVMDGTTTAPEVWPGIGVATGEGTAGKHVKWISSLTLGDALISELGDIITVTGKLGVTTLTTPGSVIYSAGTVLNQTEASSISRGGLSPFLRGNAASVPTWTTVQYPDYPGLNGQFIIAKDGDWYNSNLQLPYSTLGDGGVVYSTGVNQWGQSPYLSLHDQNLTLIGNMNLTGYIGSPNYSSQTTGWRIDSATGSADFRYLYVDEMQAKSFINDLEQALVGGQIIAKSAAMLALSFVCPAPGATATLRVRDIPSAPNMPVFESGDMVVLRTFSRASGILSIADCVGYVTGFVDQPDGTQSWTLNRNSGTEAGTMAQGTTVAIDSIVLDYGRTGNGYYEVNAVDGAYGINSPYAQVVTWEVAPTPGHKTLRTRFGNLYGITGLANEYGMIAGTYSGISGQYFRASNSKFELHGIDLYLWDGSVNTVKLSHNIPSFALGYPLPSAFMGANPGVWMGRDGDGIYKFRVGNPSSSYAAWNGSTFNIVGAITALSGNIAGDLVVGTGGQIRSGATTYNNGIGWWLDYNAGTPRFRVGNPLGDRIQWDGSGLNVKSGLLTIDGSYGGRVGIGALPYSIATLNVAALDNTKNTMSLFCTGTSGGMANTSLICYGDGSIFLGHEIHLIAGSWSTVGAGLNPNLQSNGPFGSGAEPGGWMRIFVDTGAGERQGWIPIWLG